MRHHRRADTGFLSLALAAVVLLAVIRPRRRISSTPPHGPRELAVARPTFRGVTLFVGLLLAFTAATTWLALAVPTTTYDYFPVGAAAVLAGLTYLTVVDDVPLSERAAGPVASCANALWLATLIAPAIVAAYDGDPTWHPFGLALTGLLLCLVATAWRPVQVTLRRSRRRS